MMAILNVTLAAPATVGISAVSATAETAPAVHAAWLRVPDVKGAYTIPYIQSSRDLELKLNFADSAVVTARVQLLRGGQAVGAEVVAMRAAPVVRFTGLASAEYAVQIRGVNAAGTLVTHERHERIAIGTVIAALGDSITEGYHSQWFWRDDLELTADVFPPTAVSRDRRNYPQYTPTTSCHRPEVNCFASWMPHLNDLLTAKWQQPVFIANEGWGGITTGNYLNLMKTREWQARMRLLNPTVWLIHLGVNDERAKLGADVVAANLANMVDLLVTEYAAAPEKIFICQPCYDYADGAAPILEAYGKEIDKLIATKGLRPGPDFFKAYAVEKERYYGADPVHPNIVGMELMAELWAEALTE